MTDFYQLAYALETVALLAPTADAHDKTMEAASILRAAASVDVAGLMELHDAAVAAAIAVALERKGDRDVPSRAALESALRMALAGREPNVEKQA